MALISLEDLDALDDDQLDNDITDNREPMDEDERERLLTHWRAVASTHHVSVAPGEGMAPTAFFSELLDCIVINEKFVR